ncbi:MAG TPA: Ni/Fe hydrogenase subunit alpha [candidate division Zixibacteria bacterium]|nr:Ni/Fe hydrogenase subunit alpha [candidate division Zixibacteria bacterium]
MQTITIDPVTRIEGHARITLQLDDSGAVNDARFHVTQVRGFEKLTEGRPFTEMPAIMARICGICPVSHLLASSKACDAIMAVQIPDTGWKLRRIMNLAQIVQSHALSFFHLSSPDLLLGMDTDPAERNIIGVLRKHPDIARSGIRLRQFGQQVIETLGGKRVHPGWIVPGGVSHPLEATQRDTILAQIPEAITITKGALAWFKGQIESFRTEIRTFANFPTLFMAMANEDNEFSAYTGWLRVIDADGKIVADHITGAQYRDYIGEYDNDDSYLKTTYFKPYGYPEGIYRVGPLARMNMCKSAGTPMADEELAEFRELERHTVLSSFYYHYARLIEVLFSLERMQTLLEDKEILSKHVRAFAAVNNLNGVGITEAPRGTLIHDYTVDENGLMRNVNLIIATGHNNMAINKGVLQVAKHFVKGDKLHQGMLNRVEAVVRCYDPCLSCSTHADGHMAMQIELCAPDGRVLDTIAR